MHKSDTFTGLWLIFRTWHILNTGNISFYFIKNSDFLIHWKNWKVHSKFKEMHNEALRWGKWEKELELVGLNSSLEFQNVNNEKMPCLAHWLIPRAKPNKEYKRAHKQCKIIRFKRDGRKGLTLEAHAHLRWPLFWTFSDRTNTPLLGCTHSFPESSTVTKLSLKLISEKFHPIGLVPSLG